MTSLAEKLGFGKRPQEKRAPSFYDVAQPGLYPYVSKFVEELNRLRPDLNPTKIEAHKIPKIIAALSQQFNRKDFAALLLPPDLQQAVSTINNNVNGLDNIALFPQDIIIFLHEINRADTYIHYGIHTSLQTAVTKLFTLGNMDATDFQDLGIASGFYTTSNDALDLAMLGVDLLIDKNPEIRIAQKNPYITFDLQSRQTPSMLIQ